MVPTSSSISLTTNESGLSRYSIGEHYTPSYTPSLEDLQHSILDQKKGTVLTQHDLTNQDTHTEVTNDSSKSSLANIKKQPHQPAATENLSPQESTTPVYRPGRSLRAPVVMLFSLVLGLGLALEHHFMNTSLDNSPVSQNGPLSQQWTARFSTALAFLVKMMFVTCIGTAFVQRQWLNILRYQQSIQVKDADILSMGLSDPFSMFFGRVWLKFPLLLLVALASWTIPFAAVIAPAALSIELLSSNNTMNLQVPQLSFDLPDIPYYISYVDGVVLVESQQLSKASFATATAANILAIKPEFSNQTYSLNFFGPALKCETAKRSDLPFEAMGISFIAWTGEYATDPNLAWENYAFSPIDNGDMDGSTNSIGNNTLWIASAVGIAYDPGFNITKCQLYNASYDVEFRFQNYEQTLFINQSTYIDPVWVSPLNNNSNIIKSWKGIMSALGSLLVGTDNYRLHTSHYYMLNIDFMRAETTVSGVEELFRNITLSLFSLPSFLDYSADLIPVSVTTLTNTYVYQRHDLLLSYGISFVVSLVCCAIGLHSFWISQDSYQNTFSAYMSAVQKKMLKFEETTSATTIETKTEATDYNVGRHAWALA